MSQAVILSAQWVGVAETAALLPGTVDRLVALNKTVLLLGQAMPFPFFNVDCPNVQSNATARGAACASTVPGPALPVNALLQQMALVRRNVLYWDLNAALCPSRLCSPYHPLCLGGLCRPDEPRLRMMMQMTHVSYYGSRFLGDKVLRQSGVPWELRALVAAAA